jgi:hypothetical protein
LVDKGYGDAEVLAPAVNSSIRWRSLDLFCLIRAGRQKKLDALITVTFSLIGKQKVFAVQQDSKVEIGVISRIEMASRVCVYGSLFLSVELVLFTRNAHQLRQKCLFCVQINMPITLSSKRANVRKLLNFAYSMQRERAEKGRLLNVYEPVSYEERALLGESQLNLQAFLTATSLNVLRACHWLAEAKHAATPSSCFAKLVAPLQQVATA